MAEGERIILCGGAPGPSRVKREDVLDLTLYGNEPNVNLEISNISRRLASDIPDELADLIEIAAYIYSADQAVTRGGDGVVAVGENWRRRLHFHIPTRKPEIWSSPSVSDTLKGTLSFLSDDEYSFHFTQQSEPAPVQKYLRFDEAEEQTDELDSVLLFSGGLDSLGGAVEEAVFEKRRVALVSHRSNSKIHSKQKQLVRDLTAVCAHAPFHIPVWVNKDKALGKEHTQRTRSFLFACLAFTVARAYHLPKIRFYENGVVSLNLPISEQVVGARATRTTHPQVLNGFANLFSALAGMEFCVENPFLWLTKGEVIDRIGDRGCAELIKHSVSCTHTLDQTKLHTHCGRCSQCVSRRFAALASKYRDHDPPEMYKVDLLEGEREEGVDLTLVESFIRTAADIKAMNEFQLVERFGEVSRVLRHVRPLSADQVAERVVRLHRKHAAEVGGVMESALSSHSSQILEEKLPPTCAIILAVPGKYRHTAQAPKKSDVQPPTTRLRRGARPAASNGPYSKRDDKVFVMVGKDNFKALTNEDIENRFRPKLREIWGRKNGFSPNALRSCLNRIRRHHGLPRSEEIRKNAVNQ
ncbi:MAG: 7-cyano-7-deazaguanine synthase [Bryobacteraceae bacterium]